ncbi:MAG: hypothetical protein ISS78_02740 [Phycisphaerae bacterium]|nr:hypothetical protein [Phycisphaerae bacterium]
MKRQTTQDGVVSVLAVIFLAMFAAMGIAYAAATNNSMLQADNLSSVQNAQLQADSGLEYFTHVLRQVQIPSGLSGQDLLAAVELAVAAPLNTEITAGGTDRGFTAALAADDRTISLTVSGRAGAIRRAISMDFEVVPGGSAVFHRGVSSMGSIEMMGNARLIGLNLPGEADVYSGTYATDEAYNLTGNCSIDGDIYAASPDAYATITGSVSIAGEGIWSDDILDHIHMGTGDEEFPEVNPAVFEPFATSVVDADTSTGGNITFSNIRILANVNPSFSGNINLNGVTFVEQPNDVQFTGNINITGVIVTEDAGDGAYESNKITFTGNTTVRGVEQLPDSPEYAELKQMPGSFLLAPGFGVEFTGNFGTVSGTMAADKFTFTGNAGGTVQGSIVCYSDAELTLTGNSNLTFDRSTSPSIPPGFTTPDTLDPAPATYREH